jgi:glycosyltransferase involved in cell wall biosynthesis
MKRLTIAIPTFNRNDVLRRHLPVVLSQLTPECALVIVDNHSDEPVIETVGETLAAHPHLDITVVRNSTNIGGNANIIRCIELCETEWLWILGDDDLVKASAVQTVLERLGDYPDCTLLNFCGPGMVRTQKTVTTGVSEFIDAWDSFSNILFISVNIYNAAHLRPCVKFGYHYAYTSAPHLATLIQAIRPDRRCCFLTDGLLDGQGLVEREELWAPIVVFLGRMLLLELPLSAAERRALYEKLRKRPRLEYLIVYLVMRERVEGRVDEATFLYDHIVYRTTYYSRWMRIMAFAYRPLIRWPRFGHRVLRLLYNRFTTIPFVKQTRFQDFVAVDRFNRL